MDASLAHVVHIGADVGALNAWYREVFDVRGFLGWPEPHELASERRLASMFLIGDLAIETMAPMEPIDDRTPVARSFLRHGDHLSSLAFRVDDLAALGNHLIRGGVYIGAPGGGRATAIGPEVRYFVPSPRDLAGVRLEFLDVTLSGDPRPTPGWLPEPGPLGVIGTSHVTLAVADPVAACATFTAVLGAEPTEGPGAVRLGDTLLAFVQAVGDEPAVRGITLRAARAADLSAFGAEFTLRAGGGATV